MHVIQSLVFHILFNTIPQHIYTLTCYPHSIDCTRYIRQRSSRMMIPTILLRQQAFRLRHMVDACVLEIFSWESISHQIKTINNCAAREIFIFNANGYMAYFFLEEHKPKKRSQKLPLYTRCGHRCCCYAIA